MFDPIDPSHRESKPLVERPTYPPMMVLGHTLLGAVLSVAGLMGMLVGWGVQRLTAPAEGEGLISLLVTGIAAQLGDAYQAVGGWLLMAGVPLLVVGWGLRTERNWARFMAFGLAVIATVLGLWLIAQWAWVPAMVPMIYAIMVGWFLTRNSGQ